MTTITTRLKKIRPQVLAFIVIAITALAVGVLSIWFLISTDNNISASSTVISNITDTSMTITWLSDEEYVGSLAYREGDNWRPVYAQVGSETAWDVRDVELNSDSKYVQVEAGAKKRYTHHVTLRNLKPDTTYSFRVGGRINGKEMSISSSKTHSLRESIDTPDPAYGLVEGFENDDTIVLIERSPTSDDSIGVSAAVTAGNGSYTIDFLKLREVEGATTITIYSESRIYPKNYLWSDNYKPFETITKNSSGAEGTGIPDSLIQSINAQEVFTCRDPLTVTTTANANNIRSGPSTNSTVFATIEGGLSFSACAIDSTDEWYKIDWSEEQREEQSTIAYIHESIVRVESGNTVEASDNVAYRKPSTCNEPDVRTDQCGAPPSSWNFGPDQNDSWCNCWVETDMVSCPRDGLEGVLEEYYANCTNSAIHTPEDPQESLASQSTLSSGSTITIVGYGDSNTFGSGADTTYLEYLENNLNSRDDVRGNVRVVNSGKPGASSYDYSSDTRGGIGILMIGTNDFLNGISNDTDSDVMLDNFAGGFGSLYSRLSENVDVLFVVQVPPQKYPYNCDSRDTNCLESVTSSTLVVRYEDSKIDLKEYNSIISRYSPFRPFISNSNISWDGIHLVDSGQLAIANTLAPVGGSSFVDEVIRQLEKEGQTQEVFPDTIELPIIRQGGSQESNLFDDGLISEIAAQPVAESDPELSETLDSIIAEESGRYRFFAEGATIAEREIFVEDESIEIRFFADYNANGLRDEGEEFVSEEVLETITLSNEAEVMDYRLSYGWNLIHLPLVDTRTEGRVATASGLIDHWNDQGGDVTHMARFIDGQFEIFSERSSGNQYGQDFDLVPGEGIFVLVASGETNYTFSGARADTPIPLRIANGWNLLGIGEYPDRKSAADLMDDLQSYDNDPAVISSFQNGLYTSLVRDDGIDFGNDFNLVTTKGYFVKINQTTGNTYIPFSSPVSSPSD